MKTVREAIRVAIVGDRARDLDLPGLEKTVDRVLEAIGSVSAGAIDPRKLGGAIVGPGGPYGHGDVVIDPTNCVLLEGAEVAIVGAVRGGVIDDKPVCCLVLRGRINKTDDRVQALYLMNEDGAAGIVTELIGLHSRAGWSSEFMERVQQRMREMPL